MEKETGEREGDGRGRKGEGYIGMEKGRERNCTTSQQSRLLIITVPLQWCNYIHVHVVLRVPVVLKAHWAGKIIPRGYHTVKRVRIQEVSSHNKTGTLRFTITPASSGCDSNMRIPGELHTRRVLLRSTRLRLSLGHLSLPGK